MKNDSRVTISGLQEDVAIELARIIKREPLAWSKRNGPKIEIDHPDPDSLLENEYDEVNSALEAFEDLHINSSYFGDSNSLSEVASDLNALYRIEKEFKTALQDFKESVSELQKAYEKLKKEKGSAKKSQQ